jgi:hypothetical protein
MSRRQPKAGGPSSAKNTIIVDDSTDGLQDLAASERQLDSDNDDDATEGLYSQTLQKQVETLTQSQSHTDTILQQILSRINELSKSDQTNPGSRAPQSPVSPYDQERDTPASTVNNPSNGQRYTKKLPDPTPLSDGKEPTYLSWKIQIQGKLRSNADHFPNEEDKMLYLFNRTSGDAQKHLQPRFDDESATRFTSAKEMLAYLSSIYVNPNAVRDARHEYNSLAMKPGQSFTEFQTQFLHLAGQAHIPPESWRMDLFDRMTITLKRGIAPMLRLLPTYQELAADLASLDTELRHINIQVDQQNRYRAAQKTTTARPSHPGPDPVGSTKPLPTTNHQVVRTRSETPRPEPRRPAPADVPPICFNCKKPGHFAVTCPEPQKGDLKEIEEEDSYEEDISQEEEDKSGKEEP